MKTKTIGRLAGILMLLIAAVLLFAGDRRAKAAGDLDEILDYTITVDLNPDGTLNMVYHIEWKVLDDDSEGPLTWVQIGVPNKHYSDYKALTDTIKSIKSYNDCGETKLRIDFDKMYYEGEVVTFEFSFTQDYMYQMNYLTEGETVYEFTPGWFNDLYVDKLTIRWNDDQAESWTPSCEVVDGYLCWTTELANGEKYTVSITYPNEAFSFDSTKTIERSVAEDSGDGGWIAVIIVVVFFIGFFIFICVFAAVIYKVGACFGMNTDKKITRTRVEYYPTCPGCGGPRTEGKDNCEYCGRSFIKSEEKIEEKDIPEEEKELRNHKTNGLYRYSSSPNTYVRVNVINVPRPRSTSTTRSSGGCAHSSCACACACACACSGGGRAGCTTKDFYRTNLKLRHLQKHNK